MITENFQAVLDGYLKAPRTGFRGPIADVIIRKLPSELARAASINQRDYKIEGSCGRGVWAQVPWVCVFDRQITTTAQRGYYIVYLFSAEMDGVYLSLNQGWTQFERKYRPVAKAQKQIRSMALKFQSLLRSTLSDFDFDTITLRTKKRLGRGYELGHICGKYYAKKSIPNDATLIDDLRNLIGVYREVKGLVGHDVFNWVSDESEEEYQIESNEVPPTPSPSGPLTRPEKLLRGRAGSWKRDPGRARVALERAAHKCEIDGEHKTFTLRTTGRSFVEAHHLVSDAVSG